MFKAIIYIFIFYSLAISNERENIVNVLESYNDAFARADYSDIVNHFDYPASFNLPDKTIDASCKFKLKLIYKSINNSRLGGP